jgi:hypothetical protein
LRVEAKTIDKDYERENDHPWGLHNNLLVLDCPKRKFLERGQCQTGEVLLVGIALPRECLTIEMFMKYGSCI